MCVALHKVKFKCVCVYYKKNRQYKIINYFAKQISKKAENPQVKVEVTNAGGSHPKAYQITNQPCDGFIYDMGMYLCLKQHYTKSNS